MNDAATPRDLFEAESQALESARQAYAECATTQPDTACHAALGDLLGAYERLLRETRRMVRRSDRAELEMNRLNQRLQDLAGQLQYRATHDPLTGVLNRAAIIEHVNQHLGEGNLALIVLDIDHFKRVNDSFGHPVGDKVILGVVACLKAAVPEMAQIGRVGGEEFTVLLPRHGDLAAVQVAEAARRAIEAHDFQLADGSAVTASFGVSCVPQGDSFDEAYGLADQALYAAKRGGRNRVMRATEPAAAHCAP